MNRSTTALTLLLSAGLGVPAAHGEVVVNDTFDIGAPPTIGNDAADPLDLAWVAAFNNTSVTVGSGGTTPGAGNYLENDVSSGFSLIRGALPVDAMLTLDVGDTVTLSFDVAYSSNSQSAAGGFRFGLFDSTGLGTVVQAGVASGNTGLIVRHDTTATVNADMGSGAGGADTFAGPSDVIVDGTMTSGLDNSSPYDAYTALLSITRTTASSVSISASLNGGIATVTDFDDAGDAADLLSNFSGGYIVIRNGNVTNDFRIDNVEVEVTSIPEPASLALVGVGGLLLLTGRPRRSA